MLSIDAYEVLKLRLIRDEEGLDLLNIKDKILKTELLKTYRYLKYNSEVIELTKEIYELNRKQYLNFILSREFDIKAKSNIISDLYPDIDDLTDEISDLKDQIEEKIKKISDLDKMINTSPLIVIRDAKTDILLSGLPNLRI